MELKAGYKQTEVGVIPNDWEVSTYGEVFTELRGGAPFKPSDFTRTGVKVLPKGGVVRGGTLQIDESDLQYCTENYAASHKTNTVDKSYTIVVLRDLVPSGPSIGLMVKIEAEENFILAQGVYGFKTNPQKACPNYLIQISNGIPYRRLMNSIMVGSTQVHVTNTALKRALFPRPPVSEQHAIATALSDVDALISGLDKIIAKKSNIKQAAMQQLLTGRQRLPGFSGEWESRALRGLVSEFIVPMRDKPRHFTGDIPWCRIEDFDGMFLTESKSGQHVDEQTIRQMNLKVYPTGTLLVSCSADLGRCAIVGRPLVSNQTFIGLQMNKAVSSPEFFYYYMTSKADVLNNLSSGTTISYLSREQFESFPVFVPPSKAEQDAIASILSDMDADIAGFKQQRDKVRDLKKAMMQELLTGRIRLGRRELQPAKAA